LLKGLFMKPVYLSPEQYEKLAAELHQLKRQERPKAIEAIAVAREHGDLRENAEYAVAKEKQVLVERKIGRMEDTLSRARILTEEMMDSSVVHIGCKVKAIEIETDEKVIFELVPTAEFNTFDPDAVSADSPVGKALLGKKEGDVVKINVPAGTLSYKIVGFV
jgi:transcription elongation factor GreA